MPMTLPVSVTEIEPTSTRRTTTVRITRPRTSSATAAPSTVRASTVVRARRSPKTRAVMPTLVAVRAAPTKIASLVLNPSGGADARPADERERDADERHADRGAAHRPELVEVHLEAHVEEQEDDADLPQRLDDLAVVHPAEHRRAGEDADHDLADHGGQADALGDLGRQLGQQDDDQDVDETFGHAAGTLRSPGFPTVSDVCRLACRFLSSI